MSAQTTTTNLAVLSLQPTAKTWTIKFGSSNHLSPLIYMEMLWICEYFSFILIPSKVTGNKNGPGNWFTIIIGFSLKVNSSVRFWVKWDLEDIFEKLKSENRGYIPCFISNPLRWCNQGKITSNSSCLLHTASRRRLFMQGFPPQDVPINQTIDWNSLASILDLKNKNKTIRGGFLYDWQRGLCGTLMRASRRTPWGSRGHNKKIFWQ